MQNVAKGNPDSHDRSGRDIFRVAKAEFERFPQKKLNLGFKALKIQVHLRTEICSLNALITTTV